MSDDSDILTILAGALHAMEAKVVAFERWVNEARRDLQAAEENWRAANLHVARLKAMLADPYCLDVQQPAVAAQPQLRIEVVTAKAEPVAIPAPVPEPVEPPEPAIERERLLVPLVVAGWRGPHAKATDADLAKRRQCVMDALEQLWAKGGRVLTSDIVRVTDLSQSMAYMAVKDLEQRGDIVFVKELLRPGEKRTCNAIIKPKGFVVAEPAPVVKVTPKVADAAIKAARQVRKSGTDRQQRILAGAAIREAPGNTMARDVAEAVGIDSQMLTPAAIRQVGITEEEIETTTRMLRKRIPFGELAPEQCRWEVTGSTEREAYRFCGNRRCDDDSPYCASHEWDAHHRSNCQDTSSTIAAG